MEVEQWDDIYDMDIPSGKRLQKTMERSTILYLGKSAISISIVILNYQRIKGLPVM